MTLEKKDAKLGSQAEKPLVVEIEDGPLPQSREDPKVVTHCSESLVFPQSERSQTYTLRT